MKVFNAERFCKDLIETRGKETQEEFATKLGIKRATLSLLENGKQIPTLEIMGKACDLIGTAVDEYFAESTKDSLVYLMGRLEENDREKIREMADRISIKEKYELLAKRGRHGINR